MRGRLKPCPENGAYLPAIQIRKRRGLTWKGTITNKIHTNKEKKKKTHKRATPPQCAKEGEKEGKKTRHGPDCSGTIP